MESFTLIDGGVGILIVLSALLAYSRGLVREVTSILGWVVAALVALTFADSAKILVGQIPWVGDRIGDNCELQIIAAFVLVFAVALLVASIFTPLISTIIHRSFLGPIDQVLGFFFGVFRGILLVAVVFFVYKTVAPAQTFPIVDNSRTNAIFERFVDDIEAQNPTGALDWVRTQYDQLISGCS